MKRIKMLGVVAAAAMALMAFGAGTASATTLTSPSGTVYKGEIVASVEGSLILNDGVFTLTCTSGVVKGTPNAQSDTKTVTGSILTLTFGAPRAGNEEESQCENGAATINVLKRGSLELHAIGSGPNGTLTSSGAEVTVTKFGIHCIYSTSNTDLGTLTGSKTAGETATMDISATLLRVPTSGLCAEHATWEGHYVVTTPDLVDISGASAATLTSPSGTVYKSAIEASVENTVTLNEAGFGAVTCTIGVDRGTPNAQGEATAVTIPLSTLTLGTPRAANEEEGQCENGAATINVLKRGSLELHAIASTKNGTLTSSGTEVTVTKFGIHCIYSTSNTDLGILTGSTTTGRTATIDISATLNRVATSGLCAEHATWEGSYVVTTPDFLDMS